MIATGGHGQGRRVCIIDGDPQGTVSSADLGIEDGDEGASLAQAVQFGAPLRAMTDPHRPNLDVVCGGKTLAMVSGAMYSAAQSGVNMVANFEKSLTDLCERNQYDIVLIDTAPGEMPLLDIFLATSNYLIIPTREDEGSMRGLELLAEQFWNARRSGATIQLLGVVLFMADQRAAKRTSSTFAQISEMLAGSGVEPFSTPIRVAGGVAKDLREHSVTIGELVALAKAARKDRIAKLRLKERPERNFWGSDPDGLAIDYQQLVDAVIARLVASEESAQPAHNQGA